MAGKTVAVVGASRDRSKFGNKAVRAFRDAGWTVYPIHPTLKEVEGLAAYPNLESLPEAQLDQVTFYVPPRVGIGILDEVAKKQVGQVWLNPGSESPELLARAEALGLEVIQACSIIGAGQHPMAY
jgi:uncharacterized protein